MGKHSKKHRHRHSPHASNAHRKTPSKHYHHHQNQYKTPWKNVTNNTTIRVEEKRANNESSIKEQQQQQQFTGRLLGGDAETAFGSRRRTLEKVTFVFPKNGERDVQLYHFGGRGEGAAKESSTDVPISSDYEAIGPTPQPTTRTKETLDDIFQVKKSKKQQNLSLQNSLDGDEDIGSDGIDTTSHTRTNQQADLVSIHQEDSPSSNSGGGHLSGLSVEEAVRDKVGCRPRANSTDGELKLPRRGLCDERMVLENYQWNTSQIVKNKPKGFHNLGNTCFLNSTLQCLAYLPPFCQSVMALLSLSNHQYDHGNMPVKTNHGKKITMMLSRLFQQVHGTSKGQSHSGAISPSAIVKAVPTLTSCGSRTGYKFRPGRQEDAHEFLVHLLDAMNDGELREAGINPHARGWRDKLPIPRLDETTFVHRVFGGYLRSQVKCTNCGFCSNTYDPFLDLSLEVSRKSCGSVANAFQEYTRKETLDSENRWKCSHCKKKVCAQKQLTVFRPPLSLCVQLKRFTYGGGAFAHFQRNGGGKKITKPIQFLSQMKLPLSDGRSCPYALTGIVVHVGGSASSGHYTACVKKPGSSNKWYHMDDSFVEEMSEKTVLQQTTGAYLLFYSRQEVKLEYPTPPLKSMSTEQALELGRAREQARKTGDSEQEQSLSTAKLKDMSSTPTSRTSSEPSNATIHAYKSDVSPASVSKGAQSASSHTSGDSEPRTPAKTQVLKGVKHAVQSESKAKSVLIGEMSVAGTGNAASHDHKSKNGSSDTTSAVGDSSNSDPSSEDDSANASSSSEDETSLPRETETLLSLSKGTPMSELTNSTTTGSGPVKKTKIVLDRGAGRGKIEVMLGPRNKKNSWKPKASSIPVLGKDEGYQLLGTVSVDRWDDDDESGKRNDSITNRTGPQSSNEKARASIVHQMDKKDSTRKRKMFLDRWDAMLDQGKTKKTKNRDSVSSPPAHGGVNMFQRIQSSVASMNRGRAKGYVRSNSSKFGKHAKSHKIKG